VTDNLNTEIIPYIQPRIEPIINPIVVPILNIQNTISPVFNMISQSVEICETKISEVQDTASRGIDVSGFKDLYENIKGIADKAADGVKKIMDLSDSMTQTANKVNFMNANLNETDNIQQKILNSAQASRLSYQDTANAVADLGIKANSAFSSSDEVVGFAELIGKQFQIAGASSGDATNALSQLSNAMSDGVVSGDELNSIFSSTPNIIQNIADYLGEPIDKVIELAENGELSAQTLKNSLFNASGEINDNFSSVPMTWGNIANTIRNSALGAFEPILTKVNEIANSEGIQSMVAGIINGFSLVGAVASEVFDMFMNIGTVIYDNWLMIGPIILGLVAAFTLYTAIVSALNIVQGVHATLAAISAAAQVGLNAALLACPITWIILGIIAIIAIIYIVIAAINNATGSTLSATGIIIGAIATAGAFIWNIIVGVVNAIWSYSVVCANALIGIIEWVLNVFGGGFNSFGDACANLIGNIISWFLSLGQVVTKIIDAIFGTNWSEGLASLQEKVLGWGKNDDAITLKRFSNDNLLERKEYGDAYNSGYDIGEGIDSTMSDFFSTDGKSSITDSLFGTDVNTSTNSTENIVNSLGNIDTNTASGAESATRVADSVEITDEDIKYLRDIAEREIIDRTVFKSLNVSMGGINNTVNSMSDLDGIAEYLGDVIFETSVSSMEGV
jgi:tape measure domain-containing protein